MNRWRKRFRIDPVPVLVESENPAIQHLARHELLEEYPGPARRLWDLPEPARILRKQQPDGSWLYRGTTKYEYPDVNSHLFETLKQVNRLVNQYAFTRRHPAIPKAADYFFSCQTEEGDIRGILGTQYIPYYHGFILSVLVQAGHGQDPRIARGVRWLRAHRQTDGGWLLPVQTVSSRDRTLWSAPPRPFEPTRPASYFATDMALRAFAVHPRYRRSAAARRAGEFLKARLFEPDRYTGRKAATYWTRLEYPFWWCNVLSALDSLSRIGFPADDEHMAKGLDWLVQHQESDGTWRATYGQARDPDVDQWLALAVCRVMRRLYG